MENFFYNTPTKIYFGKGEENNIISILNVYKPNKILIVYGGNSAVKSGLLNRITSLLDNQYPYILLGGVRPNPELPLVREGISLAIKEKVDLVLAIGGGSVLDTAKDIANGVANPQDDVWEYHLKKNSPKATIRKGCILTIAAAGSEMSNSCVISNPLSKIKAGYNSEFNRMDFAIMNPELTYSVSPYQTACGVVDIGMHTIERYFAIGSETDLTDEIAEAVIRISFKYGKEAYLNPTNYHARSEIMWASSLAHNGLTNCGRTPLLTVHQLEHALSALYPNIAHGAGLAALWCSWARYVYKYNIDRFYQYASRIWNISSINKEEAIIEAINKQEQFYKDINMPINLKELGVNETDLELLALKTSNNKTRVIPGYKPLGYEEVLDIFKIAYFNN